METDKKQCMVDYVNMCMYILLFFLFILAIQNRIQKNETDRNACLGLKFIHLINNLFHCTWKDISTFLLTENYVSSTAHFIIFKILKINWTKGRRTDWCTAQPVRQTTAEKAIFLKEV
jgi:hypothetical protein